MLQIRITALKPGVHHFVLEPSAGDLDLDPDRFRDIRVGAQLDLHVERILVRFTAEADVTLECDRTLEEFTQGVKGQYVLLFASPEIAEASEGQYEDVRVLQSGDQEIDLTQAVRDTLLLAIPTRRIAPGAEDRDIPMQFGAPHGAEGMVDPRWEALRKLKIDDDAA